MGEGLTKAQWRELIEMAGRTHRSYYPDTYKPVATLLALGYVEKQRGRYGSPTYFITPAGRAALSREEGR